MILSGQGCKGTPGCWLCSASGSLTLLSAAATAASISSSRSLKLLGWLGCRLRSLVLLLLLDSRSMRAVSHEVSHGVTVETLSSVNKLLRSDRCWQHQGCSLGR